MTVFDGSREDHHPVTAAVDAIASAIAGAFVSIVLAIAVVFACSVVW